jgi:hypothetical protein
MPPPVPGETTLLLPPSMWGSYWRACPNGDRLPGRVPREAWKKHCRQHGLDAFTTQAPVPLQGYWFRFDDAEQVERVSAFPEWFWTEYLQAWQKDADAARVLSFAK